MTNISDAELQRLREAKNEDEWNDVCSDIKRAHDGYPSDWWAKVKLSGLMQQVADGWGRPEGAELRIRRG